MPDEKPRITEPSCDSCKELIAYPFCWAFPEGIPGEIRRGEHDHKTPFPGDGGVQYSPVE